MKRTNLYLTEKQMERLHKRAEQEGVAIAELVRRAVDSFLAWDDPTYAPVPKPPSKDSPFIPVRRSSGTFWLEMVSRNGCQYITTKNV